jgi:hypothetical protein
MPWVALPINSQGAAYTNALSSKLSISSIPQLVVLNKYGNYITNNGKSLVTDASQDIGASLELIQVWKNAQSTPIEDVNFGVMKSFFSSVKKGYNYVTGSAITDNGQDGDKSNCNDAHSSSIQENANGEPTESTTKSGSAENLKLNLVAHTILAFFEEATNCLKKHPKPDTQMKLIQPLTDVEGKDGTHIYIVPVPLEEHRSYLLKEQIRALEDTVSRVSEEKSTSVTAKEVQEYLRALGGNNFSGITSDEDVQKELIDRMNEMNEEARTAYARSVLWSEMRWMKQEPKMHNGLVDFIETKRHLHRKEDGQEMGRKEVLEFCALCSAVVKLEGVKRHLESGRDIFVGDDESNDAEFLVDDRSTAQQRIIQLQQTMICATGFDPTFGGEELHRIMTTDMNGDGDEELEGALASFVITMQDAATKAMDADSDLHQGLTDKDEGGVTKVISVKYSEKTVMRNANGQEIADNTDAPTHAKMEQQSEENQKEQLKVASQAASMQQSILNEILSMEEEERNEQLIRARKAHEIFIQEAMSLPPGPQRVHFFQNMSSSQQKLMLIHKLWENRGSE